MPAPGVRESFLLHNLLPSASCLKSMTTETHPWAPFIPEGAKVLVMGTFPPKPARWSMDFYYPNRINDFWRVMGLVFYDNPDRFYNPATKTFLLDDIKTLLTERGIAMGDTGAEVRRLRDNASDKYLEIVRPVDLPGLLAEMPHCHTVATTGEKAAGVIAELTGTEIPKIGTDTVAPAYAGRELHIWRMPSTSRAYPLPLADKAAYYARLFRSVDLL